MMSHPESQFPLSGNQARFTYLKKLYCSSCQKEYDPNHVQSYCLDCQAPLVVEYDLQKARQEVDRDVISRRRRSMWRWHELLPVSKPEYVVTLGEGDAPLLKLPRLGFALSLPNLYLKDEGLNPTGSFKARGLSAAISKAYELGVKEVIIPTAGNAGGAMAAYASRAGMQACIFMPKDTPQANRTESRVVGAEVNLVDGLISDAGRLAGLKAQQEGWFDLSTFKEPYRAEGKKVMGYEIAEAFDWELPDLIVYPTGGGTGLVGIWKALKELAELGWLETNRRPRMVAVQAEGCAPVVRAVEKKQSTCEFWQDAHTLASGLRVPRSFADRLILQAIVESKGTAIAVSDKAIIQSLHRLAEREGIFAAPEGAATLAAVIELQKRGLVHRDERILLLNTGSGLKYLEMMNGSGEV